MKPLSEIALKVKSSPTLSINSMYKQMIASGEDVIGFVAGEPDFATPENIKDACKRALDDNKTKYTPSSGIVELKKAICERMKMDCNINYKPSEVLVASGAKHNLYLALRALLNPGDEVILIAPCWVSYDEMIKMCGAVPVVVQTEIEDNFKLSMQKLEDAVTKKTKCIIINSPNNPTGVLYSRDELMQIAEICERHDLYVISDEIYYKLIYDGEKFTSFASLDERFKERTILIGGVSKSYAMTGWRIGFSLAPEHITKIMSSYVSHSTAAPSSLSQWASVEAFSGSQDSVNQMRDVFEQRRNYMAGRLKTISGVDCFVPSGAFYIFVDIRKLLGKTADGVKIDSCETFANELLKQAHVAVVPGYCFFKPGFLRLNFVTDIENIIEGLNRIEDFVNKLKD